MNVEILCSSRELFGADRSALRLAEALISGGLRPTLITPVSRPELGLSAEATKRGVPVREEPIAIASSSGVESPLALVPRRGGHHRAELTIFNSTAVLGSQGHIAKKAVVVREWLNPQSPRHRMLALRHRIGADVVAGVSSGVVEQWRMCIRGPKRQHVVHNWLDRYILDESAVSGPEHRSGILCIGRFNRWKGQDVLASAYEQAFSTSAERPRLTFVGAQQGTAFDARAEALAERGRGMGWEVLPFTSDPSEHFRSAAVVVVPSLQPEPFGMIILEAIAYGCRVIAFEEGGPSDLAQDFPGIIELAPRDDQGLVCALADWWERGGTALSPEEFSQARQVLESRYSPEAGAASWQKIIENLAR